jgi:molecular chaperone IbpA
MRTSITAEQNVVTIEGGKTGKAQREFLYRGISTRHFKRQFSLADYVQVKGATFDNGLLKVELDPGDPRGHEAPGASPLTAHRLRTTFIR